MNDISGGTKPTVWDANCGASFGHELMFSRTLEQEMGQQNHFETVKNAGGGTGECVFTIYFGYSGASYL